MSGAIGFEVFRCEREFSQVLPSRVLAVFEELWCPISAEESLFGTV